MQVGRHTAYIAILVMIALPVGYSTAHDGAKGIVKERMLHMKEIAKHTKTIGLMIKGETTFSSQTYRQSALAIASHAGTAMTALFPEGSTQAPSEALPVVWEDWSRFSGIAERLEKSALAMADAAENPRDNARHAIASERATIVDIRSMSPEQAFRAVASICRSCHEDFRVEKD